MDKDYVFEKLSEEQKQELQQYLEERSKILGGPCPIYAHRSNTSVLFRDSGIHFLFAPYPIYPEEIATCKNSLQVEEDKK